MHDNAPIKFTLGNTDKGGRALILMFEEAFQALSTEQQKAAFKAYLATLTHDLESLPDSDPNKAGMAVIFQVCSELEPHISKGEIPLDQPLTIELGEPDTTSSSSVATIDLTQH